MAKAVIRACSVGDLAEGEAIRIEAEVPVAVFNCGGVFYAIDDTCSHEQASLADGFLDGTTIECPLHFSCFDLRTGAVTGLPATEPVRTHPVSVQDGEVLVDVPPATDSPG